MAADHLTARQTQSGYAVLGQHPLADTSNGVYYRTAAHSGTPVDWAARQAASKIWLPRSGQRGTWLDNERVNLANPAFGPTDFTLEAVVTCRSGEGYNFFGSPWVRELAYVGGNYGYLVELVHAPLNDSISDTQGRISAWTRYVGGDRVASRTVYSRPVVSDNLPHHALITHRAGVTADAISVWVDGVKTETVTLAFEMSSFVPNSLAVGIEDFFTAGIGSYSHLCLTQGILPDSEIQARAQLVNGASGPVLTDQGKVMAWNAANNAWRSAIKGWDTTNSVWRPAGV